ncbi:sigma-54-dependent transcriptional regulator [Thiolapillus brandeum]|uniref:Two component sigma54 specific transcriptional regulator Fis family n=1 Tax=Thiolapillus brandeum TaxID=1076588 RepID=A0A7U6GGW3_9GAMM|nr:sigma-54 dependent transcriptional regulator [Thiolapillus brandeum]BAO43363.1 two component sigma54 specific transcriptional regulator Fis family [Thiolapillus brandeum]
MNPTLLIIEDDSSLSQMLTLHFEDQGMRVQSAHSCNEALSRLSDHKPDLVLLDQQLPDGLGSELIPRILEQQPDARIIMMTGVHDLELAIQAIQQGATDFIHKPVKTSVLQEAVDKALAWTPNNAVETNPAEPNIRELIGRSQAMLEVSKQIALSAQSTATVLITGESGTGKEIVARLIHQYSGRKGRFVAINCAAIVDNLLESELFGHAKGAFTGATADKAGRFQQAQDGTLFLDEIGELAPQLQAKLLRALQEQSVEPVGGTQTIPVNARIIAATHRDLFQAAHEGLFREDLAYRLDVINIQLPPLRERTEDIPLLVQALLGRAAHKMERSIPHLDDDAIHKLQGHPWPGNVRELENVLTQALVQARDGNISADLIRFHETHREAPPDTEEHSPMQTLEEVEARHIQKVLDHTGGHKANSCRILGISRPALDRKIRKYELRVSPAKK